MPGAAVRSAMKPERKDDGIDQVSPIPEEKSVRGIGDAPHLTPDFSVQDWGFDTVGIAFEIGPDAEFSLQALRSANTKHNALLMPGLPQGGTRAST